jgi:hypothetical protein
MTILGKHNGDNIWFVMLHLLYSLLEQELYTLPEHLSSPPVFSEVRVPRSLVLCVMFCRSFFVPFHLAIVLSVLRFTGSNYPFGIFKLFLSNILKWILTEISFISPAKSLYKYKCIFIGF